MSLKSRLMRTIGRLWNPSLSFSQFSLIEKLFFLLLCLLEPLYRLGFVVVMRYKRLRSRSSDFPFCIISVGNLSVGGTGKSVFVSFLTKVLGPEHCAVVLRGYKGSGTVTLVSDGNQILCGRGGSTCGDEAMMYALRDPRLRVAVGKNRADACALLAGKFLNDPSHLCCVILDDAYQNVDVAKDVEIVLLDARKPFENGHCLPAGRLREKDLSRADIIIVTHADCISAKALADLKIALAHHVSTVPVFTGAHVPRGVCKNNEHLVDLATMGDRQFLVAAGVGSFDGVVQTVRDCGASIGATHEFGDHHAYTHDDIQQLYKQADQSHCAGIIVTEKDWVKIHPLLQTDCVEQNHMAWYVIRVAFEFLSSHEYAGFVTTLQQALK